MALVVYLLLSYRHSRDLRYYQDAPLIRRVVGDRLFRSGLKSITANFDSSVLSTGRFAEGTAVRFNREPVGQTVYPISLSTNTIRSIASFSLSLGACGKASARSL